MVEMHRLSVENPEGERLLGVTDGEAKLCVTVIRCEGGSGVM